jgi:hypothetical protein
VENAIETTYTFLAKRETTEAVMASLLGWIERCGVPAIDPADSHVRIHDEMELLTIF